MAASVVPVTGGSAAAAAARARAVVIDVPGLRWSDLAAMPTLRGYAATSAVGALSVHGLTSPTPCVDGELTFSASARAAAPPQAGCSLSAGALSAARRAGRRNPFAAHVGAFGTALHGAGLTTAAVGADAVPLVADGSGRVDHVVSAFADALTQADVVAVVDPGLDVIDASQRRLVAGAVDRLLARQLAVVPSSTDVVVAGLSDDETPGAQPQLHVCVLHAPGVRHGALHTPVTPAPYLRSLDLAPTLLQRLGVRLPTPMLGRPATVTAEAPSPSALSDANRHALVGRGVGGPLRAAVGALGIAVVVLLAAARRLRSRGRALRGVFAWAARVGLATPVASYLSQLWPWWRWSPAGYAVSLGALAVLLAVLARLLGRAAGRDAELVALPGLTAAVLFADQIAGAPLQLSAPLGDNPIVAGRFHGMGNVDFALFAASVLLCAAVVGGRLRAGGRGRLAVAAPAVLALLGVAVDAAPSLGDDFGGLLAFLPAAVVLVAVLSSGPEGRLRWRPRRVAGLVVALVAVGVAVALGDYARPAASQTHVGAFVGTVLHGGAGSVLSRKFSAMGRSFGDVAVTGFVGVVVVVGVLARRAVAVIVAALPGGAAAALAVAVLALLGTVLNDSGVVVAEMALLVPVLAVVAGRADEVLPDASRPTSRPRRR